MASKVSDQTCASQPTTGERRSWRNIKACFWWTVLFVATFLIGGRIFEYADWAPEGPLAWGLSLVPIVPGTLAFLAFKRFFREADEMIREIYAEGMLFGVGAVLVFWGAIQLPEHVWLPKVRADIVVAVMLFGFCAGLIRANWRRK
jgi:hypothetical protein